MFRSLAWLVASALTFVAVPDARANEPFFFDHDVERSGSHERSQRSALTHLGRRIFFDARLSGTGTTACASCHRPDYAFAEPRRVSVSDNGAPGRRNAPSLLDVGFQSVLMWDGRFRLLEQQALSPFRRGEMGISVEEAVRRMNADPVYLRLFGVSFDERPTAQGMARALAAYQRTLVSGESRVERYLRTRDPGLLSRLEHDGLYVFAERARCGACHRIEPPQGRPFAHAPPMFTDMRFHNLGIGFRGDRFIDVGRYAVSGVEVDVGAFRTPSLRNVARTAPYMHDGSLSTLEEVVEFYDVGGRPNPNLSPRINPLFLTEYEKAALVAFLRGLTDPQFEELRPVGLR
jgi:cytochrome c peroxidase